MKKILLPIALVAALFTSCRKEVAKTPAVLVPVTFEGSCEADPETRTVLDAMDVKWSEGDKVAIFDNLNPTTPHEFTVDAIDGKIASFSGEVTEGADHFLAVYPYSAAVAAPTTYTASTETWYSNAIIPPVQDAVAGSFDPKALVATGGTNLTEGKFRFYYTGALLKFQVSDDDVTSVIFSSSRNMSGIIQFNQVSKKGGPSGIGNGNITYGQRNTTVTVKAESTFTKGVDYYAFIRYTGSASYESFKAILTNTKGGTAEKASQSDFNVQRKNIYDMGKFAGLTWDNPAEGNIDLYQKYSNGEDIVIGGVTYNKTSNGEAVLLTTSEESPRNLGGDQLNSAGNIVFLAPGTYTTGGEAKFTHDIVVIGQMTEDKPVITTAVKTWNISGVSFIASNLHFDLSGMTSNQFFTNKTATKDIPRFVLEDCVVRNCPRYLYATNSAALGIGINEILVNRCVLETSNKDTPALFNVNGSMSNPTTFKKFTISNCVCYHSAADPSDPAKMYGWLLFNFLPNESDALNALEWPMVMSVQNNIFYNIASNSSNVRNYAVADLTISGNLIVCPGFTPTQGMKIFSQRMKTGISLTPHYGENRAYAAAGTESNWILADNAFTVDILGTDFNKKIPLLGENPLETADLEKGEFVVKAAYKDYGPQK